jgi:ADP-ribosylglycohydrolase/catechol 2,3-dioxygenase-like lactoylglutathione lyase family enzyme
MLKSESHEYKLREKAQSAFWGAATGDALGWPQEMPSRRVGGNHSIVPQRRLVLSEWRRRSGGRFLPHEEIIRAGEYSDDTQLLLCCARSILSGVKWLRHFVEKELPSWSIYQRGAGGATKRAVDAWIRGEAPWKGKSEDRSRYFDAGGNGVAMRILPHALHGARDVSFSNTRKAIFLNGICTHGHPRALIGALCYGYIAWEAFRYGGTLPYGYLLQAALSNKDVWSSYAWGGRLSDDWIETANDAYRGSFEAKWKSTVAEMTTLLRRAQAGIDAGALSIDSQVLSDLGCFDRTSNGAGTVCAAAAAYLASKYAPDPQHGILEAAFALGADTDTVASMTSSVLGAVSGSEWLLPSRNSLQDQEYIGRLADHVCELAAFAEVDDDIQKPPSKRRVKDILLNDIAVSNIGSRVLLPDGREAKIEHLENLKSSPTVSAKQWQLRTLDGQTIYIKRLTKVEQSLGAQGAPNLTKQEASKRLPKSSSKVQAIRLVVEDLERSRNFYGNILGLRVTRESKNIVNFGGIVTLVPFEYLKELESIVGERPLRSIICIETKDIDHSYKRLKESGSTRCTPFAAKAGRRLFRCFDPDDNIIEVFEAAPKISQMSLGDAV